MRASDNFIEVTGAINHKKFLVNKSVIIFVTQEDSTERAVIETIDGDRHYRIIAKESYSKVADLLLEWCELKIDPFYMEPGVCEAAKKETENG